MTPPPPSAPASNVGVLGESPALAPSAGGVGEALDLLSGRPLMVLTGAGVSTDSGIPDYRGPGSTPRTPMTYQEFVSGSEARRRYWARVHTGSRRISTAAPNVDGLHEAAGSRRLVALHGRISDVVCLECRAVSSRQALERRLAELNPGWAEAHADLALRPDGDVELTDWESFRVADCADCGGVLKPDVVFFGENVPPERVARCYAAVEALADTGGALLVAGSSLAVMSGLRFVKRAARLGVPVVIVNRGPTRGDPLAAYKLEVGCSEFLCELSNTRSAASRARRARTTVEPSGPR